MADAVGQFLDIIDNRIEKHLDNNTYGYVRQRGAVVTEYDNDSKKAFVYFVDDESRTQYTFYNKTNELLSSGDNVKVYYVTNIAKGWIGERCGEPNIKDVEQKPLYVSISLSNDNSINYNAIEKTVVSVDFDVIGDNSDVTVLGNLYHEVSSPGSILYKYKIDGIDQNINAVEDVVIGRKISPIFVADTLEIGKHNVTIDILTSDGALGTIGKQGFTGSINGQIDGISRITPPNEDLILELTSITQNTIISLPLNYIYDGGEPEKPVSIDWGDGSEVLETTSRSIASHQYNNGGDYTITCKCVIKKFKDSWYSNTVWDGIENDWNNYIKLIRFPDNAEYIVFDSIISECQYLENVICGNSANTISLNLSGDLRLSMVLLSATVKVLGLRGVNTSNIRTFTFPKTVETVCRHSKIDNTFSGNLSLLSLNINHTNGLKYTDYSISSGTSGGEHYFEHYAASCTNLQKVTFGSDYAYLGSYMFYECTGLKEIIISSGVKNVSLNRYCISGCKNLNPISFPNTIELIDVEPFGFSGVNWSEVNLPEEVKKILIQGYAFSGCTANSVYLPPNVTFIGSTAFDGCNSTIKVKSGSYAEQWAIKNNKAYEIV